jgi:rhodanese-related sulfurtransferase
MLNTSPLAALARLGFSLPQPQNTLFKDHVRDLAVLARILLYSSASINPLNTRRLHEAGLLNRITREIQMKTITPKELNAIHAGGEEVDLIDVRTPVEFREIHVSYARNVPLDSIGNQAAVGPDTGRTLYVICHTGGRSAKACEKLLGSGYRDVVSVEGGTSAWDADGLPVVRGKKAVSLERQVRIAAGSLVVAGVALGFAIHPAFFGLSGFVGAGLIFAGITDTCAMGMVIAKMPWNQLKAAGSEANNASKSP